MSKRKKIKRLTSKKKSPRPKHIFQITNRIHFKSVENLAGFCVETAKAGEMVKIQARGSLVSDDPLFYIFIDQITSIFLQKVLVNSVYQFLVIIHEDLSADIYFNEVPTKILMMTKRALKRGEIVRDNDIADIKELIFESVAIKETDKLIYCFKVGWKFGLFFDLYRENHPLNLKTIQLELGALYRYLCFQYVYDLIDSEPHFEALKRDGWFPFIELLGSEFREISKAYKDPNFFEDRVKKIVDKFGEERINGITEKWWQNSIFLDKKQILMAGINSYMGDNKEGFITCIKTLLPEIEGIIRLQYFSETGKGKDVTVPDLISHIIKKGSDKTGSELSLFLPRAFFEYLKDCVFLKFDLEAGKVSLSRHTSSHGVARTEDYTKTRALQMILILDQVYFYI